MESEGRKRLGEEPEKGEGLGFRIKSKLRRPVIRLMVVLNRVKPPGFGGVGLYDVLVFFFRSLSDRRFNLGAAAMAFRFFFALFPGMIFIFSLLPLFQVEGLQEKILQLLSQVFPGDSLKMISATIGEVFTHSRFGTLSFNLVLALYTSLSGIKAMMFAFSKTDQELFKRRNIFQLNLIALLIFVTLSLVLIFAVLVLVFGELGVTHLVENGAFSKGWAVTLVRTLQIVVMFLSIFVVVSFIYYFGPETNVRWDFINPGSLLAGSLIVLALFAFKYFLENFSNYNKIYGSLSAIMVLMVWFYWMSIVLLIGFELNAAIAMARHKEGEKEAIKEGKWLSSAGDSELPREDPGLRAGS